MHRPLQPTLLGFLSGVRSRTLAAPEDALELDPSPKRRRSPLRIEIEDNDLGGPAELLTPLLVELHRKHPVGTVHDLSDDTCTSDEVAPLGYTQKGARRQKARAKEIPLVKRVKITKEARRLLVGTTLTRSAITDLLPELYRQFPELRNSANPYMLINTWLRDRIDERTLERGDSWTRSARGAFPHTRAHLQDQRFRSGSIWKELAPTIRDITANLHRDAGAPVTVLHVWNELWVQVKGTDGLEVKLKDIDHQGYTILKKDSVSLRKFLFTRVSATEKWVQRAFLTSGSDAPGAELLTFEVQEFYAGHRHPHLDLRSSNLENMDEMRLQYDQGPKKTLALKGAKIVKARAISNDKGGFTLMVHLTVDRIHRLRLIVRGTATRLIDDLPDLPLIRYDVQPRSWVDGVRMQNMCRDEFVDRNGIFALFDNFPPHFDEAAVKIMEDNGNKVFRLVPNATFVCQPADQLIKYIRMKLRPRFYDFMIRSAVASRGQPKIPHPNYAWFATNLQAVADELNSEIIPEGKFAGLNAVQRAWALCGLGPYATPERLNPQLRDLLNVNVPTEVKKKILENREKTKKAKEARAAPDDRRSPSRSRSRSRDTDGGQKPKPKRGRKPKSMPPPPQIPDWALPVEAVIAASQCDDEIEFCDLDDCDDEEAIRVAHAIAVVR